MKIFLPSDTVFTSQGERSVTPISCVEHREISEWNIECKFTLDDVDLIKQDYILIVETKEKGEQPFRINNVEVGNTIYCKAYHVGYDTKHYAVQLSTVLNGNCNAFLVELISNIEPLSTPFKFSSDINLLRSFSVINVSLYEALGQIASEYAGSLDFDGWNVYILNSVGQDRGLSIEYGKNLESATVTEDWENVVTKLKPIGNNGITLTPEWLTADISYAKPYTKIMTFNTDTVENLELVAQLYLDRFKLPKVNYSVKSSLSQNGIAQITVNQHGQLVAYTHEQLAEFSHAQISSTSKSQYFGLGDTIVVKARQFEVTTDVISYDYNCLTKYVIGIEFGNYRPTVKNFFNELKSTIEESTTKRVQVKIDQLTGDFTIVANNYNNGLLQGTYYNFDGNAFTITNSLDEVVFSADALGNLTLVGDIKGYSGGILRTELKDDALRFYDQDGNLNAKMYAGIYSSIYEEFYLSTTENWFGSGGKSGLRMVKGYEVSLLSNAYTTYMTSTPDSSLGYVGNVMINSYDIGSNIKIESYRKDVNGSSGAIDILTSNSSSQIMSVVQVGGNYSRITLNNSNISLDHASEVYFIRIGGALKQITRDASGFLKAV